MESGELAASDEDADEEFASKAEVEDIVDSDFAETDSEAEQAAAEASEAIEAMVDRVEKRRQRKAAKKRIVPRFASTKQRMPSKPKLPGKGKESSTVVEHLSDGDSAARQRKTRRPPKLAVRVSSRTSAVLKAQESEALEVERSFLAAAKRGRRSGTQVGDVLELTQEQLLEEAKQTEIRNVEKLKEFQEQEAEEKHRQRIAGSRKAPLIIRPVAHWVSTLNHDENSAPGSSIDPAAKSSSNATGVSVLAGRPRTKYVLESLDDARYPLNPWARRLSILPPKICPVTGLPARYIHPRTKIPYANLQAYRVLEELARGEHAFFCDIGVWGPLSRPSS
ncbi:Vacuolar protein sorting-associated protein 72 [Coemansia sp. RSA 2322]|nr:Vacuolar protein sorting-associated protein 72 [Coemansia sp. RSA 2322]